MHVVMLLAGLAVANASVAWRGSREGTYLPLFNMAVAVLLVGQIGLMVFGESGRG
jgi:hypothetical protein